jgi:hypothetical protein
MKEYPILFTGEMVRAILEGRKTQTRRIRGLEDVNKNPSAWTFKKLADLDWMTKKSFKGRFGAYFESHEIEPKTISICPQAFPYGRVSDRLWVCETWAHDDMDCKDVKCGNRDHIWWKASETKIVADSFAGDAHWRPSIFMPRWASRITLEIVNVRVERIQDISGDQCTLEGIQVAWSDPNNSLQEKMAFKALWDSINAKRGYSWEVNPWVWVIEFKRLK